MCKLNKIRWSRWDSISAKCASLIGFPWVAHYVLGSSHLVVLGGIACCVGGSLSTSQVNDWGPLNRRFLWEGGSQKGVFIYLFFQLYIWSVFVTVQVLYISVDFEEQIYICIFSGV